MRLSPIAACAAALAIVTAGCASAGASGPGSVDGAAHGRARAMRSRSSRRARTSPSSQWHGLGNVRAEAGKRAGRPTLQARRGRRGRRRGAPGDKTVAFVQPHDDAKLDGARAEAQLQAPRVRRLDRGRRRRRRRSIPSRTRRSHLADNARLRRGDGAAAERRARARVRERRRGGRAPRVDPRAARVAAHPARRAVPASARHGRDCAPRSASAPSSSAGSRPRSPRPAAG